MCGEIQWSALGRNRAAVVGYNSEGNAFENHPLSGLTNIGDTVSCTFDIGRRRKRQNNDRPNNMPMPLPADDGIRTLVRQCLVLAQTESIVFTASRQSPNSLAEMLDPCPCTPQQAEADRARYMKLPDDTKNCYISANPLRVLLAAQGQIGLTQMCCYVNQ